MAQTNSGPAAGRGGRRHPGHCRGFLIGAILVFVGWASGCGTLGVWQDREPRPHTHHRSENPPSFWRSWFADPEPPPPPQSVDEFMRLRRLNP